MASSEAGRTTTEYIQHHLQNLVLGVHPENGLSIAHGTEEAAARETMEEAHADIQIHSLLGLFSLPHVSQVYVVYRAHLQNMAFKAGPESLEVNLVALPDIPWDELAFPVIHEALSRYVKDIQAAIP